MVNVRITEYPTSPIPGRFPIPSNAPIENWPLSRNEDTKALPRPGITLEQFQREGSGDRHMILVDPARGASTSSGRRGSPTRAGRRRRLRLSISHEPACVRSDGRRLTPPACRSSRRSSATTKSRAATSITRCVSRCSGRGASTCYPARHFASTRTDPSLPRMGERLRLRRDFDITGFPPHAQAVLKALKRTACSWRTTAATGCCRSRRTVESQGSNHCPGSRGRTSKWSSRPDRTRDPEHERANDEPAGDGLVSRAGGCLCGAIE